AGGAVTTVPGKCELRIGGSVIARAPVDKQGMAAGAPPDAFRLAAPTAAAPAPSGSLYVLDGLTSAVFLLRGGVGLMLAGRAEPGILMNGYRDGTGDRASFCLPAGIASDGKGL